jgi:hypothetical protein
MAVVASQKLGGEVIVRAASMTRRRQPIDDLGVTAAHR